LKKEFASWTAIKSIAFFLLFCSWFVLNIYFLVHHGIVEAYDTPRYISEADKIIETGKIELSYNYWSSGYIFTIYFFKRLGFDLASVVAFQMLASLLALFCCFKAGEKIYNKQAAFISAFLYIGYVEICWWNTYILTESLFMSFTLISFYLTLQVNSIKKLLLYLPVFIFSASLRPFGFVILLSIISYFLSVFFQKKKVETKWVSLFLLLIILPVLLLINKGSETYTLIFIDLFKRGDIIADYTNLKPYGRVDLVDVNKASSLFTLFELIFRNLFYSLQLFILKLLAFLAHIKPYYSFIHNLFIACCLYPTYFFFIKSMKVSANRIATRNFIVTYLLLTAIIVMVSVEDGDGRYLMPVLPLIFVFASKEILKTGKSLFKISGNQEMHKVKNGS
jgi:4-amino-4-deoxy-L-arabinose transferase-like glycosyltransferase